MRRVRGGDAQATSARSRIPGIDAAVRIAATRRRADSPRKFLSAVHEAAKIYRHIAAAKGAASFITEVSMDETDEPQTPPELLIILAALADRRIPAQTIAPKFTGRFNKGVDYVGDVAQFEQGVQRRPAVIAFAVEQVSACRPT